MQIQNGIEIYRVAFSINNARYPMAWAKEVHTANGELNISSITKVKEIEIAYFLSLLRHILRNWDCSKMTLLILR